MAQRGRPPKPPSPRQLLKETIPVDQLFTEDELDLYNKLVDIYLDDFDEDDLTYNDMDDILDLVKNRVLEFRLLKDGKNDTTKQIDASAAIDKLGKKNEKIKESLFARRRDRVSGNEFQGFSIVDLVVAFSDDKKSKIEDKLNELRREESKVLEKRKNYMGNKDDINIDG